MNVVFIHYFGGKGESWQWVDSLLNGVHAYYMTLPGFGGTTALKHVDIHKMANAVLQYLAYHEIKECVLVGHSMGGKLALLAAAMAKDVTIQKVVLVAPSPPTIEAMPEREKIRMLHHPDYTEAETTVINGTYQALPMPKLEFAIQTQLEVENNTWKWWLEEGMKNSVLAEVENLKVPLYLICSEHDNAITKEMIQDEVLSNLRFEKIYTTSHVGHLLPIENPQYVAAILKQIVAAD
ncbi:alpha/beta fold hydrolase [Neptunitalea lumnitzerae]|uniref:Hydrolase n=1 Tax=Neptunitalea lumnitzerae TaxID=2965509 RepID=A0ABQ5MFQ1_9FLAO|nr:alpha/beta hydrolase [Neptunitalea sp. Y10]GLB48227.1 hydrolase [Neptunitalea sp. Y10]